MALADFYEIELSSKPGHERRVFSLLKSAAGKGLADAKLKLGAAYEAGFGTRKNIRKALEWYESANRHDGDADVQFRIGRLYEERVMKRPALRWYRKAAIQGHVDAQFNLALLYDKIGGSRSLKEALHWYTEAANRGDGAAATNVAIAYAEGRGIKRNMKAAAMWFRKAADAGDPKGLFNLGRCYDEGLGVKKDVVKAVEYYLFASIRGNVMARNALCNFDWAAGELVRKRNADAAYTLHQS